ncbi:MAG: hypothetical protein LBL91_04065 [Lachnospiraceae bacterium]|jgi:hypothetical protein|nr:hypothetical protein [Lachnospiraceae bacterium]
MIEELVGKTVEIIVAFSIGGEGSAPVVYTGRLLATDADFCKIAVESGKPYMVQRTICNS